MIGEILFFTIFFSIFILMHYYPLRRVSILMDLDNKKRIILISIAFPLIYFLLRISFFSNGFIIYLSSIFSYILGIFFIFFSMTIVFESVLLFIKNKKKEIGIIIVSLTLFFSIISIYNFNEIEVNTINLYSGKVDREYKIVQLSDIHLGTVDKSYLVNVLNTVKEINPEIVLITGDLLDAGYINYSHVKPLNDLDSEVYYVLGNHEFYVDEKKVLNILKNTKVKILRNQSVIYNNLQIIGIDDNNKKETVESGLKNISINDDLFNILMYHRPVGFRDAADKGIDLMLCGHTHSGQIIPFNLFVKMAYVYDAGLFQLNKSYLYVSAGTALWGPKMRLGSKNEVTVFNIKPN